MPSHLQTRLVAAGSVLLLAGVGLVASTPTAAAASCSGLRGDVNGDGYAEVAVGEPGNDVRRGGVHVLYGQSSGLVTDATGTALADQSFAQGAGGVPGTARHHNDFGLAVTFGDLNGDGCADLVVGAPGGFTNYGPTTEVPPGTVTVLYGSTDGITTAGAQILTLTSLGGDSEDQDQFGSALATGDLDGDGIDDLAVGAPHVSAVGVAFGARGGLGRGRPATIIDDDNPEVPATIDDDSRLGGALAIGDFDGDRHRELAVGVPLDSTTHGFGGSVLLLGGGASGYATLSVRRLSQETAGVPGRSEVDDAFGAPLAAGDITGDGRDDLAVGVPGEDHGAGAVVLLKGSKAGLTGSKSQKWSQDSAGVSGAAEPTHAFGGALAVGRLDTDGKADLAIGAPVDAVEGHATGSVTILRGASSGLTTAGIGGTRLTPATSGITGSTRSTYGFGASVAAAQVQGAGQADLIIGVPFALSGSTYFGGLVHQLPRGTTGPKATGSRVFYQSRADLSGTPADGDGFGLSAG